ncbi:MAG TPA: AAA family ATPase [Phycisphaerae bacterium]|nr:AAA family ATPase [Phycisphaerae bacterium]
MIESVEFKNFKVLRDATLPLGRFTLLIGPNGSGKTTALQGLDASRAPVGYSFWQVLSTAGVDPNKGEAVQIILEWSAQEGHATTSITWPPDARPTVEHNELPPFRPGQLWQNVLNDTMKGIRLYCLEASVIAQPVQLQPSMELQRNGHCLPGVLDRLRDGAPERFEALNDELGRWLPEFDKILFSTPGSGLRGIALRTRRGQHEIPAANLSQGTLLALTILTLAYLPAPPPLIGLEEPDRGIHPRLLRDVRDALYRLSYPEQFGEEREPVQVVATTHSPYMLDLYRDHPEEIVIAQKNGQEARFERLTDRPDVDEILQDAHLGDLWYSGILGGVPAEQ